MLKVRMVRHAVMMYLSVTSMFMRDGQDGQDRQVMRAYTRDNVLYT